jgi:hypothetical protein
MYYLDLDCALKTSTRVFGDASTLAGTMLELYHDQGTHVHKFEIGSTAGRVV